MMRLMAALADSIRAEFIPYLIPFMIPLNLSAIPTAKRFSRGIPDATLILIQEIRDKTALYSLSH